MDRKRPTRSRLTLATACAGVALAGSLALPSGAPAAVPQTFHGVVAQSPVSPTDVERLRAGGVGSMRFLINWKAVEPERGLYDFRTVDQYMASSARSGAEPLPFVFGTPGWAGEDTGIGELIASSEGQLAWRQLLVALTLRYGPNGYFWPVAGLSGGVDIWQLGNEPNLYSFWGGEPNPSRYARLLGIGADAIASIDPSAEIAMAGLPPGTKGPDGWTYLDDLLEVPGVAADFDYIAPHPYSPTLKGVRGKLDLFRRVLVDHGLAGKRMLVTEIGWMAGGPKAHPLRRSKKGQAKILKQSYSRLAADRSRWGLDGAFWFSWQDPIPQLGLCSFCGRSGLFDSSGRSKPAWSAFKNSVRSLRR